MDDAAKQPHVRRPRVQLDAEIGQAGRVPAAGLPAASPVVSKIRLPIMPDGVGFVGPLT